MSYYPQYGVQQYSPIYQTPQYQIPQPQNTGLNGKVVDSYEVSRRIRTPPRKQPSLRMFVTWAIQFMPDVSSNLAPR